MNVYILDNSDRPIDPELRTIVADLDAEIVAGKLPERHEEILEEVPDAAEGAVVFLPSDWTDLNCVKATQELVRNDWPVEVILVGSPPDPARLAAAFNEGVSAFLETPLEPERVRRHLNRAMNRCEKKKRQRAEAKKVEELLDDDDEGNDKRRLIRDAAIGRAFLDVVNQRGPLLEGAPGVLVVSSSSAQLKALTACLSQANIKIESVGTADEALRKLKENAYAVVISDQVLADGTAADLSRKMRKQCDEIPALIVWTSSSDKIRELRGPENFIDSVVLKPGPDAGVETILLEVVANLYRQ